MANAADAFNGSSTANCGWLLPALVSWKSRERCSCSPLHVGSRMHLLLKRHQIIFWQPTLNQALTCLQTCCRMGTALPHHWWLDGSGSQMAIHQASDELPQCGSRFFIFLIHAHSTCLWFTIVRPTWMDPAQFFRWRLLLHRRAHAKLGCSKASLPR